MRKSIFMVLLSLFLAVPAFAVDGVLSGIISSDDGGNKDIYGSYIVWKANDGTIKLYNLTNSQTSVIGQGDYPKIYKDTVIWTDSTRNNNVVKYDIKTGITSAISTDGNATYPWIYGTKIVWSRYYDNSIQVYDIFSGQTTTLPVMGTYPVVYENMLTYKVASDVHLYDLVRLTDTIVGTQNGMFYAALIDDNYVYWEGYDSINGDTINRYSISDNIVLTPVPICTGPSAMTVSNGKVFFDGNCGGPQYFRVRQFDPKTGSISVLTAPLGTQPNAPAVYGNKVVLSYWPDGLRTFDITSPSEEIYSLNSSGNTVTVINPYKNAVVDTISTGTNPSDAGLSPDETKLYVLNSGSKTVTVAQTYGSNVDFQVIDTKNVNPTSNQLITAVAGDNDSNVYVALKPKSGTGAGIVRKISSAGATDLSVGVNPNSLKISPDNKTLFVSNADSSKISSIALATFTLNPDIATGTGPRLVKP